MPWHKPGSGGACTTEAALERIAELEHALGCLLQELESDGDPSRKEQACIYAEMIYLRDAPGQVNK